MTAASFVIYISTGGHDERSINSNVEATNHPIERWILTHMHVRVRGQRQSLLKVQLLDEL